MKIGYARVSTRDQNLNLQTEALAQEGCELVFSDTVSGSSTDRPGLKDAFNHLSEGDTLIVWKFDRLGRSLKDLINLIDGLNKKGISFYSITDHINTSTPSGKFFFHVIAALSEMERDLNKERTLAGLKSARAKGRIGGRKTVFTPEKKMAALNLLKSGMKYKDVAKSINVSLPTLYRHFPASENFMR